MMPPGLLRTFILDGVPCRLPGGAILAKWDRKVERIRGIACPFAAVHVPGDVREPGGYRAVQLPPANRFELMRSSGILGLSKTSSRFCREWHVRLARTRTPAGTVRANAAQTRHGRIPAATGTMAGSRHQGRVVAGIAKKLAGRPQFAACTMRKSSISP